jgi:hypothetical protein
MSIKSFGVSGTSAQWHLMTIGKIVKEREFWERC